MLYFVIGIETVFRILKRLYEGYQDEKLYF